MRNDDSVYSAQAQVAVELEVRVEARSPQATFFSPQNRLVVCMAARPASGSIWDEFNSNFNLN
jgi:hypothetical protein